MNLNEPRHSGVLVYRLNLNYALNSLNLARRLGLPAHTVTCESSNEMSHEIRVPVASQRSFWPAISACRDAVYDVYFLGVERVEQVHFPSHAGVAVKHHDMALRTECVLIGAHPGHIVRYHDDELTLEVLICPADEIPMAYRKNDVETPVWANQIAASAVDYEAAVLHCSLRVAGTSRVVVVSPYIRSEQEDCRDVSMDPRHQG